MKIKNQEESISVVFLGGVFSCEKLLPAYLEILRYFFKDSSLYLHIRNNTKLKCNSCFNSSSVERVHLLRAFYFPSSFLALVFFSKKHINLLEMDTFSPFLRPCVFSINFSLTQLWGWLQLMWIL